jgi:pSer/pThr/pTyr-binding forkhead associated (FHA) protein
MATLQRVGDEALCPINLNKMRIGRSSDNEIVIEDDAVSGHHALITVQRGEDENAEKIFTIEDLNSTNHTYVNNNEIKSHVLTDGDIIRLGTTRLKFSTREYVPPQDEFQETRKISGSVWSSFLFKK